MPLKRNLIIILLIIIPLLQNNNNITMASKVLSSEEEEDVCEVTPASTTKRTLNDGTSIPVIALGVYQTTPGKEAYNSVREALRTGYRHIDSAKLYNNEQDVGKAVKDSGLNREEIFITTKLWSLDYDGNDPYDFVMQAAEESLKKLDTYIDLYLIHSPHNKEARLGFWKALEDLKKEGRIKSIGVSNYGIHHIQEILDEGLTPPAVNQVEIHPFLRRDELVQFCKEKNIIIEAYSPLAKAMKMDDKTLVDISKKYKKSPAQILIRWSLQKEYITLPKSSNPIRIKENSEVFDFEIKEEDMNLLDTLDEQFCTGWDPTTIK